MHKIEDGCKLSGLCGASGTRMFAIITAEANELGADIHDRMPLILAPTHSVRWPSDDADPRD